jgi:AcrR family transcriptional regulator
MGTKERQDRERQALRDKILTAARELFLAEGFQNVSMRKIAERIEYSPAAIYSYFRSKDDIFFALAKEGFGLIGGSNGLVLQEGDPLERVRGMFLDYYRFARQYPQFFELMFVDRSVPQLSEHWERFDFMLEKMDMATAVIQRAIDAGVLPPHTDAATAFHILWAAVHGPATIALCNRLAPGEDPDALALDVFEAAFAGLRAGTRSTFVPACPPPVSSESSGSEESHVAS